jgi:hypothetical protein
MMGHYTFTSQTQRELAQMGSLHIFRTKACIKGAGQVNKQILQSSLEQLSCHWSVSNLNVTIHPIRRQY